MGEGRDCIKRVILDASRDLDGQIRAAKFALGAERPADGFMIVSIGGIFGSHYGVRWNRGSVRVYPQSDAPTPAAEGGE